LLAIDFREPDGLGKKRIATCADAMRMSGRIDAKSGSDSCSGEQPTQRTREFGHWRSYSGVSRLAFVRRSLISRVETLAKPSLNR